MCARATNLAPEYANLLANKVVIDPSHPLAIDEKGLPITGIQVILDNSLIASLRNLKATAETER